ncbi:MAG: hypothetical protein ACI9U2_005079, partial [Bradymonadia bacterium]
MSYAARMHAFEALTARVIEFSEARDWRQFHTPK